MILILHVLAPPLESAELGGSGLISASDDRIVGMLTVHHGYQSGAKVVDSKMWSEADQHCGSILRTELDCEEGHEQLSCMNLH